MAARNKLLRARVVERAGVVGGETGMPTCLAVREVLALIGDKWSVQVISLLGAEPQRFNELRRAIDGISQRMLALTLRHLERDGLVTRTVFPDVPPRVEYDLSRLGRSLLEPIRAVVTWAEKNRTAMTAARTAAAKATARTSVG